MRCPRIMQKAVVLVLVFTWVFSGWPQFQLEVGTLSLRFPSTIPRAHAVITASTTVYATAGTFTYIVSTNACNVDVAAWGAGGAGFDGTNSGGGAGGGGGAFASSTLNTLTIGSSYTIVVGAGGSTSGANGANSTFNTSTVIAEGGKGGTTVTTGEGVAGLAANSTGVITRNGGQGGSGNNGDDGGGGGGGGAGQHGVGGAGGDASTTVGGGGGGGDGGNAGSGSTGGTSTNGGAGGNGDTNGATTPNGVVGFSDADGGGGGGGGDQASSGGGGGSPGGGGAGGEVAVAPSATPFGVGARGQVTIKEFVDDAGCVVAPTVSTDAASGVNSVSAILNGQITATGGANSTVRGFAWGTNSMLSNGDTATTTETGSFGVAAFTNTVSGLIAGRTYYFRAYATNTAGTGFDASSPILSFTAGAADTTIARTMRLFEGSVLKLLNGRIIVHQK